MKFSIFFIILFSTSLYAEKSWLKKDSLLYKNDRKTVVGFLPKGVRFQKKSTEKNWQKISLNEKTHWLKKPRFIKFPKTKLYRIGQKKIASIINISNNYYTSRKINPKTSRFYTKKQLKQKQLPQAPKGKKRMVLRKISGGYSYFIQNASVHKVLKRLGKLENISFKVFGKFEPFSMRGGSERFHTILNKFENSAPAILEEKSYGYKVTPRFSIPGFRGEKNWSNELYFENIKKNIGLNSSRIIVTDQHSFSVYNRNKRLIRKISSYKIFGNQTENHCNSRFLTDSESENILYVTFHSEDGCENGLVGDFKIYGISSLGKILFKKVFRNFNCTTIYVNAEDILLELFEPSGHNTPFRKFVLLSNKGKEIASLSSTLNNRKIIDYTLNGYYQIDGSIIHFNNLSNNNPTWKIDTKIDLENLSSISTGPGGIVLSSVNTVHYVGAAGTISNTILMTKELKIIGNSGGRYIVLQKHKKGIPGNEILFYDCLMDEIITIIRLNRYNFNKKEQIKFLYDPITKSILVYQVGMFSRNIIFIDNMGRINNYKFTPSPVNIYNINVSGAGNVILQTSGTTYFIPVVNLL